MKNIWTVFQNDLKKIYGNVIAMIVIMGITVLPTLYAWFNISGSWDPYQNTGNLKVAVASEDAGYEGTLLPVQLNIGDQVLAALGTDSQLDWVFTTSQEAEDGVSSGDYYAAIVIPEDFSRDMMQVFTSGAVHPEITCFINEKENAIAPKVTEKGAGEVQQQINNAFIEKVSQAALSALQLVSRAAEQTGDRSVAENLAASLLRLSSDLDTAAGTVQAFADLAGASEDMLDTTADFLEQSGAASGGSLAALKEADRGMDSLSDTLSGTTDLVNQALSQSASFYRSVDALIGEALDTCQEDARTAASTLEELSGRTQRLIDRYCQISSALDRIAKAAPLLSPAVDLLNQKIQAAIDVQTSIRDELNQDAAALTGAVSDASAIRDRASDLISQGSSAVQSVQTDYEDNIKGQLGTLADSLCSSSSDLSVLVEQLNESTQALSDLAGNTASDLSEIKSALARSSSLLQDSSDRLAEAAQELTSRESEGLDAVAGLLSEDPRAVTAFLSSPVSLKETRMYAVENYGSAMAPFYSTLAIWVGAVVMAAMLKVAVPDTLRGRLVHPREHQLYIGRLLLFLCLGFVQSTLICLGDLYFLEIQCRHPFLFVAAGWFSSFVYVNLIYALTVSFGDIGKAAAVVLMVMQVAGSGGTFPIEVAPPFFRAVYPLLPFTHSMNAMRECIAGFYKTTYLQEMAFLGLFLIPSLLLGLFLRKPVMGLNRRFMKKLEDTRIL